MSLLRLKAATNIENNNSGLLANSKLKVLRLDGTALTAIDEILYTEFVNS